MGLLSYFVPQKAHYQEDAGVEKKASKRSDLNVVTSPLAELAHHGHHTSGGKTTASRPSASTLVASSREARFGAGTPSTGSGRSSADYRGGNFNEINDIKCDVMVNYLHQQQRERLWTTLGHDEGVVLKKARGQYACCPSTLVDVPGGFMSAIGQLNVRVAMSVNTKVIKLFLHNNTAPFLPLSDGLRLQVLPDMSHLPRCQKHQFAAFIDDIGILVVWDDDPRHILERAAKIENKLLEMIWYSDSNQPAEVCDEKQSKRSIVVATGEAFPDSFDIEKALEAEDRPIVLWQAIVTSATLALTIITIFQGAARVATEVKVDGNYTRLALLVVMPIQIWLALFFYQSFVGSIMQFIGPVNQLNINSKYYSGLTPKRINQWRRTLPHVTIQIPVHKEGLWTVIQPTIFSIKAAISTYEMQGGTANIFVNDDGMQLIGDELALQRREFYEEHNVGWVARPKHNAKPAEGEEAFHRRGKFKKASNMNYALWVSNRVEDRLVAAIRHEHWTQEDEDRIYCEALQEVITEDAGKTWAEGNIRVGDYILLVDSDTRVPEDCFLNAISEMEQSPQVAIVQYSSGVMNVTTSFFEAGITFFTNLVYTAIQYAVANGDIAPFVGHNAVLRWSAVQSIAYQCKLDGRQKFWSEDTVSEDFDMALRLQTEGYIIRLGAYTGKGFKEGVSLTVYDELARWEKYAYGCSELVFHPLRQWPTRGPLTPSFRRFVASSAIPLPSKCTILAYVGTYYALASSWILTLLNYFITGWYQGYQDHYYLNSFHVYIGIIIVFTALGNVMLAVLRYRIEEKTLVSAVIENFSWMPLLTLFFSGVSLHLSQAILSHLFGVDMTWGATAKELEHTTFFAEIPKVLKKFKVTFVGCVVLAAMMVYLARFGPPLWRIDHVLSIWPLATVVFGHFMLPIVLNPNLMLFTW